MNRLPPELVFDILEYCVANHYGEKNSLLVLRTVCKLFDEGLRPFVLRTIQLEYTRLNKATRRDRHPDEGALQRVGHLCRALYLDMMVIRDDEEVNYLKYLFSKVPSMTPFVSNMRDNYCLSDKSFTEVDYRNVLGKLLEHTPALSAVRLNLPFQLVSPHVHAATMILGNSFEALAQRPDESESLETLVLENVTDTSVIRLWNNPRDVKNIISVFAELKHLVVSVRRHEDGHDGMVKFRHRFWEMIGKAAKLSSLCLYGLDLDDHSFQALKQSTQRECTIYEWQLKKVLPTIRKSLQVNLPHLTNLELRRVEVSGCGLLSIFTCFGSSLRELYLNQVYLKTTYSTLAAEDEPTTLWIGLPNVRPQPGHRWIATCLRQIVAQLRICRVTQLGYDQYLIGAEPAVKPGYDMRDPCGLARSLEQRFVEVATGIQQPDAPDGSPVAYWPEDEEQVWAYADRERPEQILSVDWCAAHYLAESKRNTTSNWHKSIDCTFSNHNQFTLDQLHQFADIACEGMAELNRSVGTGDAEG